MQEREKGMGIQERGRELERQEKVWRESGEDSTFE